MDHKTPCVDFLGIKEIDDDRQGKKRTQSTSVVLVNCQCNRGPVGRLGGEKAAPAAAAMDWPQAVEWRSIARYPGVAAVFVEAF
jgi:hypothetical protein